MFLSSMGNASYKELQPGIQKPEEEAATVRGVVMCCDT
jgi:hypothetical protein